MWGKIIHRQFERSLVFYWCLNLFEINTQNTASTCEDTALFTSSPHELTSFHLYLLPKYAKSLFVSLWLCCVKRAYPLVPLVLLFHVRVLAAVSVRVTQHRSLCFD